MGWNNRIVERTDGTYSLHEVYYHYDGRPRSLTASPVHFASNADEGPSGIIASLRMALDDAVSRPVLIEAEAWPDAGTEPMGSHEVAIRDLRAPPGYSVEVAWSADDGAWIARSPKHGAAAHGDTATSAIRALADAIDGQEEVLSAKLPASCDGGNGASA